MFFPIESFTVGTYTITDSEMFMRADTSGGNVIFDMPSGIESVNFLIKKLTGDANTLTVNAPSGKTIDGLSSIVLTANKQCVWLVRQSDGNYDIVTGGGGGTTVVRDTSYLSLASDQSIGTSLQDVSTMTYTLVLATAGKVVVGVDGIFNAGGSTMFGQALGVKIGSTDYIISERSYVVGSGSDKITTDSYSGRVGVFLTPGTYTIKLRAQSIFNGSTLQAGAMLIIEFPELVGGGSIIGSKPSGPCAGTDVSGTYPDSLTVIGLQGDILPSSAAKKMLRRNAAGTAWEFVEPVEVLTGGASVARRGGINLIAGTNITLTPVDDSSGDKVDVTIDAASGGAGIDMADAMILKPFFTDKSLLPSTVIREDLYTWPTAGFSNLNSGTVSVASARVRFTPSGNPANIGWDAGASYAKTLLVVGGLRPQSFALGIFVSRTVGGPVTNEPKDGFMVLIDSGTGLQIFRSVSGGAQAVQATEAKLTAPLTTSGPNISMAIAYDGTTVKVFIRYGSECWIEAHSIADASFADFRYYGIFFSGNGASNVMWAGCPLAFYGQ